MKHSALSNRIGRILLLVIMCMCVASLSACRTKPIEREFENAISVNVVDSQFTDEHSPEGLVEVIVDGYEETTYIADVSHCGQDVICDVNGSAMFVPTEPFDPDEPSFVVERIYVPTQ